MSEWFSLFADLDPLANPDNVGRGQGQGGGGCWNQALRKEGAWCVNYIVIMEEGGKFYFKRLSIWKFWFCMQKKENLKNLLFID